MEILIAIIVMLLIPITIILSMFGILHLLSIKSEEAERDSFNRMENNDEER